MGDELPAFVVVDVAMIGSGVWVSDLAVKSVVVGKSDAGVGVAPIAWIFE